MTHFGKSRLIVYFRISIYKLNVSGGYEGISLFLNFVTMRSIVQFRLGIFCKIFGLPVEIYLTYSVYVRFCQTNIFLLVYITVPSPQVDEQNLTCAVTKLPSMPWSAFLVVVQYPKSDGYIGRIEHVSWQNDNSLHFVAFD